MNNMSLIHFFYPSNQFTQIFFSSHIIRKVLRQFHQKKIDSKLNGEYVVKDIFLDLYNDIKKGAIYVQKIDRSYILPFDFTNTFFSRSRVNHSVRYQSTDPTRSAKQCGCKQRFCKSTLRGTGSSNRRIPGARVHIKPLESCNRLSGFHSIYHREFAQPTRIAFLSVTRARSCELQRAIYLAMSRIRRDRPRVRNNGRLCTRSRSLSVKPRVVYRILSGVPQGRASMGESTNYHGNHRTVAAGTERSERCHEIAVQENTWRWTLSVAFAVVSRLGTVSRQNSPQRTDRTLLRNK